jgi:hypothetical protein
MFDKKRESLKSKREREREKRRKERKKIVDLYDRFPFIAKAVFEFWFLDPAKNSIQGQVRLC